MPDDPVSVIIPYKNMPALVSYYLGVFSLIPCLGIPLAIGAIPLGIMGLKAAKANREAHGTAHAWVGIIAGSVMLLGQGAVIVLMIVSNHR